MSNRSLKKLLQAKRKVDDFDDSPAASVLGEELDMVNNMLKRVERVLDEDISRFQAESDFFINNGDDDDEDDKKLKEMFGVRRFKYFSISWNPDQQKDGPYQHIQHLQMRFTPMQGEMQVSIRISEKPIAPANTTRGFLGKMGDDTNYNATYQFGFSNTDTIIDMKKRFMRMNKRILSYWQEEVPKLNKQKSNDIICKMFPAIVDEIILEEMLDEEGND